MYSEIWNVQADWRKAISLIHMFRLILSQWFVVDQTQSRAQIGQQQGRKQYKGEVRPSRAALLPVLVRQQQTATTKDSSQEPTSQLLKSRSSQQSLFHLSSFPTLQQSFEVTVSCHLAFTRRRKLNLMTDHGKLETQIC
jgi:hypothetical protein